jgi:methionyl-tRNA formyltransferase
VVAYGLILPQKVLAIPRFGAINLHPSLLPRWRGATPIQSAILAGDAQTGITIIQLNSQMDAGPVIYQTVTALDAAVTSGKLHNDLAQQGAQALLSALDLLTPTGWPAAAPQDDQQATYTRKITKSDGQIDWRQSATQLDRNIRAYHPWPVAFTHFHDKILRIWQAQVVPGAAASPPGTLIHCAADRLDVATGEGILRILTVQLPGGRPISVADFMHGQRQHLHPGVTRFFA